MNYTTRTTCRACGSSDLVPLFSLGEQFVSDFVDMSKNHELLKIELAAKRACVPEFSNRVPIDIDLCKNCTLVQARHTAPQELLYSKHYWYKSGTTQTMRDALRDVTRAAEERVCLKPGDVVLDIGSNDGTLLRSYQTPGIVRIGVEPAANLREEGSKGVDFLIQDFWGSEVALRLVQHCATKPKVVTACGMFYDLEDPNAFIAAVSQVLAPSGVFIAQLMCLKQTVEMRDVGNFAHEHLEFYSLRSLVVLLSKHGLEIVDIEENNVNGGSYRLYIQHKKWRGLPGMNTDASRRVSNYILTEIEPSLDLHNSQTYAHWFESLKQNRSKVECFIREQVAAGKKVWVYGASTKGNVILQWYGLDYTVITAAADRDPNKWGKYTVGTGIPIVSDVEFREANPDFALMLPYAFGKEILEREQVWRYNGGKFIVPIPEMKVV